MNKFLTSAAIGVAALAISANASEAQAGDKETEKCYGVAKAGANDCGSKVNGHSCAGHAEKDADGNEFIAVPKGLCERLAGGELEPAGE